jgi:hypothetical protein
MLVFSREYGATVGQQRLLVRLEIDFPGRTFVVIPLGGRLDRPRGVAVDIDPDYQKFDRALATQLRPVLVPLQRQPFRAPWAARTSAPAHRRRLARPAA